MCAHQEMPQGQRVVQFSNLRKRNVLEYAKYAVHIATIYV